VRPAIRPGARLLAALVIPLLALLPPAAPAAGIAGATSAYLDPVLTAALNMAGPTDRIQAVAVYGSHPSSADLKRLARAGVITVPYRVLDMVAIEGTTTQLLAVGALSGVTSIWGNHPLDSVLDGSGPLIQAPEVWAQLGVSGAGVGIAVLDSGIDATHPDLRFGTKTVQNVKLVGFDKVFHPVIGGPVLTVENVENTDTSTGHGTHVASIAAGTGAASGGRYSGVAPGADLVGLGAADGVEMLTALSGYDWLLENHATYGIKVLNNSWADGDIAYDERDPLNVASHKAHDAGITVVFAAGNDGQADGNVFNRYAWPSWVVSVAGSDKLGQLGSYSSLGDVDHHPDVTAPGSFIAAARASTGVIGSVNSSPADFTDPLHPKVVPLELQPTYRYGLGTSMAAPHVAGVAALMLEANPQLQPDDIKRILTATATPISGCPTAACGAGLVSALAAVRAAGTEAVQAPVAALVVSPAAGASPLEVTLDAAGSVDGDGAIVAYRWDFQGDGVIDSQTTSATARRVYTSGTWHPTVVVIDDDGLASSPRSAEIRSSDPPTAVASVPRHVRAGEAATFDASASSDIDGQVVRYKFSFGDGTELVSASPIVSHTFAAQFPSRFAWVVEVTDDAGVRDATQGTIKVTP